MTELHKRESLRHYQTWTVNKIKSMWEPETALPGIILAYDMGSGKTISTLTAMRDLLDQFVIRKVLIVAPLLVAKTVWPDEIEDWEHTRAMTWTLLRVEDTDPEVLAAGRKAVRERPNGMTTADTNKLRGEAHTAAKERKLRRLADSDTDIHIINKEALPWLWAYFGKKWPYDVVVIDEASMLKNGEMRSPGKVDPDTNRKILGDLSRFGSLCAARKYTHRVIELTGTPTPKGLQNLWGLLYYVDLGKRLGTEKDAFMARWFTTHKYSRKISPQDHSEAEIMGRVKDVMFSLDPNDLDELPPMHTNIVKVKLPPKALEEYHRFRRSFVSEEFEVEAVNSGVLHNKLLQFANGSLYQEDGNDVFVHDAKLEALEQMVEELNGEPLLVAYSYQFDFRRIRKKFKNAVVLNETDTRETKHRWNNGEIQMLLAHPMSAGHGLNFQFGGHHAVWYGLTADLELYQQFNKRLLRPGQKHTVFNHHIIAEGTIDERIIPAFLTPKAESQDRVLEAIRVSLFNEVDAD